MARQQSIPGTETPEIRAIEDAAETVGDLCEKRMRLQVQEREARKALIAVMKEHNKRVYLLQDGRIAERKLASEEKVSVRKPKKRGRKKKGAAAEE